VKRIFNLFLLLCFFIIYTSAKDPRIVVTVTNSLNHDRTNEIIVLPLNELTRFNPILDPAKIYVLEKKTNNDLITQIIDKDKNGTPEELLFRSNFKGNESKQFIIDVSDKNLKAAQSLTDVRFMMPREDIAWENDKNAYRIYGPALAKEVNNGIDVWTKRVRYPIIEKWYRGDEATGSNKISYHEDHGEGADFFNVGQTLGAGSCAIFKNDSLFQPGVFATYKILAIGPLRAMFEVKYKPVRFDGKNILEVKRITLDAGSNLNKIEVTYTSDSLKDMIPFAVGIVKRKGGTSFTDKENRWVSLWGLTNEKEENGSLGTGIVMTEKTSYPWELRTWEDS
jgi:pectinesterase